MASTTNDGLWAFRDAYDKFKLVISDEDTKSWEQLTRHDLQEAIWKLQDEHAKTKTLQNFKRLQGYLTGMMHFVNAVDVFLNCAELMTFIWVSNL